MLRLKQMSLPLNQKQYASRLLVRPKRQWNKLLNLRLKPLLHPKP
jgi:hypothetical protein